MRFSFFFNLFLIMMMMMLAVLLLLASVFIYCSPNYHPDCAGGNLFLPLAIVKPLPPNFFASSPLSLSSPLKSITIHFKWRFFYSLRILCAHVWLLIVQVARVRFTSACVTITSLLPDFVFCLVCHFFGLSRLFERSHAFIYEHPYTKTVTTSTHWTWIEFYR